jgi:ankyrin repeat protein
MGAHPGSGCLVARDSVDRLLISRGANIDHISPAGSTALTAACMGGNLYTVKLLVANRANPAPFDADRCDTFAHAEKSDNPAILKTLKDGYIAPSDQ